MAKLTVINSSMFPTNAGATKDPETSSDRGIPYESVEQTADDETDMAFPLTNTLESSVLASIDKGEDPALEFYEQHWKLSYASKRPTNKLRSLWQHRIMAWGLEVSQGFLYHLQHDLLPEYFRSEHHVEGTALVDRDWYGAERKMHGSSIYRKIRLSLQDEDDERHSVPEFWFDAAIDWLFIHFHQAARTMVENDSIDRAGHFTEKGTEFWKNCLAAFPQHRATHASQLPDVGFFMPVNRAPQYMNTPRYMARSVIPTATTRPMQAAVHDASASISDGDESEDEKWNESDRATSSIKRTITHSRGFKRSSPFAADQRPSKIDKK